MTPLLICLVYFQCQSLQSAETQQAPCRHQTGTHALAPNYEPLSKPTNAKGSAKSVRRNRLHRTCKVQNRDSKLFKYLLYVILNWICLHELMSGLKIWQCKIKLINVSQCTPKKVNYLAFNIIGDGSCDKCYIIVLLYIKSFISCSIVQK